MASLLDRVGWTLVAAAASVGQPRRPYTAPARWRTLQAKRVRQIVTHAFESVPFYREWMARQGMTPAAFQTVEDLARLPLIDREDLMRQPEAFRSEAVRRERSFMLRTSGTSGAPAEFRHDRRSMVLNIAYGRRERAVVETLKGADPSRLVVAFRHPHGEYSRVHEYYRRTLLVPPRRTEHLVIESTAHPIERNIELLHRLRPAVVSAHGSYLGPLLLHPETLRPGGWRPAAAIYTADAPSENELAQLRGDWGIRVQSRYRSGEALKIAFSCEAEEGLHIHPDLCAVTVVDDQGRPLPPGDSGDIVISNLLDRATVLLNYRIGDRGAIDDRPCSCGRTFPKLASLDGRSEELVRLPNGRIFETSMATSVFKYRDDVVRYRIAQQDWRFEITVQPVAGADPRPIRHEVADGYRRLLGPDARIEVVIVDRFEHDERRKWRRIVVLPGDGDAAGAEW